MEYSQSVNVDCKEYGTKTLSCSPDTCRAEDFERLKDKIASSWSLYWNALLRVTREMAEDVQGLDDFDGSFETHDFKIEICDYDFSPGMEYLSFRVEFLDAESRVMFPVFDTSFHGLEVSQHQPVF